MGFQPVKHYLDTGLKITQSVFYTGSDSLREGQAVCFDSDFGTSTTSETERVSRVEKPSRTNNNQFAGVAAKKDYAAKTGGQMIQIYKPGSQYVPVLLGGNAVNGRRLTFTTGRGGVGRFIFEGYPGKGSALLRQTVTAVKESSLLRGDTFGVATGAAAGVSIQDTNAKFVEGTVATVVANDIVIIPAGEDDNSTLVTPGEYIVSSVVSGTVLHLTTTFNNGGTMLLYYSIVAPSNQLAFADLEDGEQSGGVFFAQMDETGTIPLPLGGLVLLCVAWGMAADVACTLAKSVASLGVYPQEGQKMKFYLLGSLGGADNDFLVKFTDAVYTRGLHQTVSVAFTAMSSIEFDGRADMAEIEYAADGIAATLEANAGGWVLRTLRGPTVA